MDFLIEGIGIIGTGYIAIGMALHLTGKFRRTSNAVPAPEVPEPTAATVPAVEDQDAPVRYVDSRNAPTASSAEDRVVPFRRPAPKFTDRDLIRVAKAMAKQGKYSKAALKWSFKRQLSSKVRAELLALAS